MSGSRLRDGERRALWLGAFAVLALSFVFVGSAAAQEPVHQILFSKGCAPSTAIGEPYTCSYTIRNSVDDAGDTLTVSSLVDHVFTTPTATSGNIIHDGAIVLFSGSATCTGGTGSGTVVNPWLNSTSCTLSAGGVIQVRNFSFYTVRDVDFALNAAHILSDQATLTWADTCSSGSSSCPVGPQMATTGSETSVTQLASTTATQIHNAAHQVVTAPIAPGTNVHDFVSVSGQAGSPTPTGNVTIDWFLNGSCSGAPAATSSPFALNAAGEVDATTFNFTVSVGQRAFMAHYAGNGTYTASNGPCESVTVATMPICMLTATIAGPPKQIQITVQAAGGLAPIVVTNSTNADTPVPPFTVGTTRPGRDHLDQDQPGSRSARRSAGRRGRRGQHDLRSDPAGDEDPRPLAQARLPAPARRAGTAPRAGAAVIDTINKETTMKRSYRKPRLRRLGLLRHLTRFSF